MSNLDCIEVWIASLREHFESEGVAVSFTRSPDDDRPNPSCHLNLRRAQVEGDLLVWESGEAELSIVVAGSLDQQHFDSLRDTGAIASLLSRFVVLSCRASESHLRQVPGLIDG